ncbi:murein hydrolase activator NlpD [Gilliamella sp. B14448G11]|uniref:murein hydrolase activator NlpD n=1 Tax=unclassified Gilliamella TaxID=2685620 RepID=UPI0018DE66D6|nr:MULTISPECIES: murein hydrolase activator NlpD [unclassified Gilliamella]MBI0028473.1 murein hydrolase activator NlpD [Gilliamella sp. B14448G7]MBI0035696.1 murein hydrolase activator NlpD [Gilliamella sp. B14448G11]MBI0042897.1 murein hydrolase activator NlpD [Gilliamella sp. B14448G12]
MKKILTLTCLSLVITACTQSNPAQIEDISDFSGGSSKTGYSKPPVNISTGSGVTSPSVPSNTNSTQVPKPITTSSSNDDNANNTTNSNVDSNNGVNITNERVSNKRNYDEIPKGGYQGDTYTVSQGDTLYYIAWVTGNDYRSLAAKNNIKNPYSLVIGQVLDVSGGVTQKVTSNQTTQQVAVTNQKSNVADTKTTPTTTTTTKTSTPVPTPVLTTTTTTTTTSGKNQTSSTVQTTQTVTGSVTDTTNNGKTNPSNKGTSASKVGNITWQWPAKGKIIEKFSNASKGIDIAGGLGNKVMAAADGRVVYSGNALPGYGNLIIIKHDDDYLTAYAHNQSILVKEQQAVRAGEQIATMGATGTSSVRLHFEVRYQAKSVDPLKYLPKN